MVANATSPSARSWHALLFYTTGELSPAFSPDKEAPKTGYVPLLPVREGLYSEAGGLLRVPTDTGNLILTARRAFDDAIPTWFRHFSFWI